jgi:hypothetical protein
MCAAILCLEAIVVGLSTPVMIGVSNVDVAWALVLGLGLALGCLLVAGMLSRPGAAGLGWALQVWAVALGFLVGLMFVLGLIFALLWGLADGLGRSIERQRAAFEASQPEASPDV